MVWFWESFSVSLEELSFNFCRIETLKFNVTVLFYWWWASYRPCLHTLIVPLSNLGSTDIFVIGHHAAWVHFIGILTDRSSVFPFRWDFLVFILFEFAMILTIIGIMRNTSMRWISKSAATFASICTPSSSPTILRLSPRSVYFVENCRSSQARHIGRPRDAVRSTFYIWKIIRVATRNEFLIQAGFRNTLSIDSCVLTLFYETFLDYVAHLNLIFDYNPKRSCQLN